MVGSKLKDWKNEYVYPEIGSIWNKKNPFSDFVSESETIIKKINKRFEFVEYETNGLTEQIDIHFFTRHFKEVD